MNARIFVLTLVLFLAGTLERVADACCLGCPCTKYKREAIQVVDEPVLGYTHAVKGAVPGFNRARIVALLTRGVWQPMTQELNVLAGPDVDVRPARPIRFITAEKAAKTRALPADAASVMIRRIEKHGKDILVEVNDRTFKLAPCPKQRGYACLVDPGSAQLAPLPPPQ